MSKKHNDGAFKVLPLDMIKLLISTISDTKMKEINFISEKAKEGKDVIIFTRKQFNIVATFLEQNSHFMKFYPKNSCINFGQDFNNITLQTIFMNKNFQYFYSNPHINFSKSLLKFETLLKNHPNCNYVLWSDRIKGNSNRGMFMLILLL